MSAQKKNPDRESAEKRTLWAGVQRASAFEVAEAYNISPGEQLAAVSGGFSEEEFEGFDEALERWRRVEGGVNSRGEESPMSKATSTSKAVITFPSEFPGILKLSESDFVRELRFLAAAKLYELGHLSSGKAAELADMDRVAFLYELKRVDVPAINLRDEQIDVEIQSARELGG